MPLAKFSDREDRKSFNKPVYFQYMPGKHTIRILDEPEVIMSYWFGRGYIKALGYDDPVALQNKKIKLENPEHFRTVKGYHPLQERGYVNVLDLTPAKVCQNSECGSDVKSVDGVFPLICPRCQNSVANVDVAPLNKIRVLSGSKTFFEQFDKFEKTVLDEEGEFRGWDGFDIILHVAGVGKNRNTVVEASDNFEPVEVPEDALFDTASIVPEMTEEELERLLGGVDFRDIMAARRATEEVEESVEVSDEDLESVESEVDKLFA